MADITYSRRVNQVHISPVPHAALLLKRSLIVQAKSDVARPADLSLNLIRLTNIVDVLKKTVATLIPLTSTICLGRSRMDVGCADVSM